MLVWILILCIFIFQSDGINSYFNTCIFVLNADTEKEAIDKPKKNERYFV